MFIAASVVESVSGLGGVTSAPLGRRCKPAESDGRA